MVWPYSAAQTIVLLILWCVPTVCMWLGHRRTRAMVKDVRSLLESRKRDDNDHDREG